VDGEATDAAGAVAACRARADAAASAAAERHAAAVRRETLLQRWAVSLHRESARQARAAAAARAPRARETVTSGVGSSCCASRKHITISKSAKDEAGEQSARLRVPLPAAMLSIIVDKVVLP